MANLGMWSEFIFIRGTSNPAVAVNVKIYPEGSVTLATGELIGTPTLSTIYAEKTGTTPKENPFLTDEYGLAKCFLTPGWYDARIYKEGEIASYGLRIFVPPPTEEAQFVLGKFTGDVDLQSGGRPWTLHFHRGLAAGAGPYYMYAPGGPDNANVWESGNPWATMPRAGSILAAALDCTYKCTAGTATVDIYIGARTNTGFVLDQNADGLDDPILSLVINSTAAYAFNRYVTAVKDSNLCTFAAGDAIIVKLTVSADFVLSVGGNAKFDLNIFGEH